MEDDKTTTGAVLDQEDQGVASGRNSNSSVQTEDQADPGAEGSIPGLRDIYINPPSQYLGIRFFAVESDDAQKSSNSHEVMVESKSTVSVNGIGLIVYDQVILKIGSSIYNPVNFQPGDNLITFQVPRFDKILGTGGRIYLEFHSKVNPNTSGKLKDRFLYYQPKEEEKGEAKKNGQTAEDEYNEQLGKTNSPGLSALMMAAMGDTLGGIGNALAGGSKSNEKKFEPQAAKVGNPPAPVSDNSSALDADDDLNPEEAKIKGTASINQPQTLQQATEVVGEYIDKNPETILNSSVRTEVLSALSSGNVQALSTEGKTALSQVVRQVSQQSGAAKTTIISSSGSVGLKTASEIATERSVNLSTASQAGSSQSTGGSIKAESSVSAETNISGQASPGGAVSEEAGESQTARASGGQRQNMEVVGEYLDKNPSQISSIKAVQNQALDILAGAESINELGAEGQKAIKILANSKPGEVPEKVRQAASSLLNPLQESPAQGAPVAGKNVIQAISENGNQKTAAPQTREEPAQKSENLPGKGNFDGIDGKSPASKTVRAQDRDSSVNRESELSNKEQLLEDQQKNDSGPRPPAGLERLEKNKNEFRAPSKQSPLSGAARRGVGKGSGGKPGAEGSAPVSSQPAENVGSASDNLRPSSAGENRGTSGEDTAPDQEETQNPENRLPLPTDQDVEKEGQEQPSPDSKNTSDESDEEDDQEDDLPEELPQEEQPGGLRGWAASFLKSRTGKKIESKTVGEATSQVWWWGFGSSAAFFFTGLDFFIGAAVMDVYWIFMHRKQPDLFPLKGWQKIVTVAANVFPLLLLFFFITLLMFVGCNYPVPKNKLTGYSTTVIGAFIGNECQLFDISNITAANPSISPTPTQVPAQTSSVLAPRGP